MHLRRYVRGSGNISCASASNISHFLHLFFGFIPSSWIRFEPKIRMACDAQANVSVCVCVRFMREMFCIRLQTHAEACTLMRKTRGFRVQIINFCLSNFFCAFRAYLQPLIIMFYDSVFDGRGEAKPFDEEMKMET